MTLKSLRNSAIAIIVAASTALSAPSAVAESAVESSSELAIEASSAPVHDYGIAPIAACAAATGAVAGGAALVSHLDIAGLGTLAEQADRQVKEALHGVHDRLGIHNEHLAAQADRFSQYIPVAAGAAAISLAFVGCHEYVSYLESKNNQGKTDGSNLYE